ncbi:MAG: TonB-dependent receptor [Sediminibacterium sp.]|nr:TonB-dependent receptor [Sediminibacterium sp.]
MIRFIFMFSLSILTLQSIAQPTQSIRGSVVDHATKKPIAFASIVLLNTNPLIGTTADSLSNFTISNVPVGRYDLKVTCIGYEPAIIREVLVSSSKGTFLTLELDENITMLSELVIRPRVNKEQPLNAMATVSARMLSVDEAKRYAGGFDDPARLATSFAGVAGNTGDNGIIVRGNAPKFLQWKMEGIEIPSPNHFGDLQSFGGGLFTALSSQMLANSDFLSGAFPAEYNNAISGVFDLAIKKGNNEKRERTIQAGIVGIENSQEGPFKKGGRSSYIYNYRYSTLAILAPLLPEDASSIKFQDLSFKLNFPTKKAGTFSIWGIGLIDRAKSKVKTDSTEWKYYNDKEDNSIKQYMGALGVSHKYFLKKNAYIKTTIAGTINGTEWAALRINSASTLLPQSTIKVATSNIVLSSFVNKRYSSRHTNKTGLLLTGMMYDLLLNKSFSENSPLKEIVNSNGFSTLLSAYSNSTINLTDKLLMNIGVNGQFFTLNNHYTIEPRLGFRYRPKQNHSFGLAYGLHSRLENLNYYFNNSLTSGATAVNKNLDFTKSHHFVFSYDWNVSDLVHFKVEPYYQQIFSVPVVANSSLSFLNLQNDWFFAEKLQNTGTGRNYGIDLTLEKYMSKGYYYMLTGSFFKSEYKGGDGVWRNTRYNRNYVFNFLTGKEWQVGKSNQNTLSINVRATYQGGNRYSPINNAASNYSKEVVFDETKAFSMQFDPALNVHFTASYRINKRKNSREIALKIVNLTRQPDYNGFKYNLISNKIDLDNPSSIIPNLTYKIEF